MNPPIHSAELDLALQRLESEDKVRDGADFELADLTGKIWHLNELKGKVVLVSFWATWCPYCRTEMPVLDRLYKSFKDRGLVVLAISDEAKEPVQGFADRLNLSFPILLDTGRHSTSVFNLHGIPTTLVYGRKGNLAGEAIDVRTEGQFYELLLKAGFDELGPKNSQRN